MGSSSDRQSQTSSYPAATDGGLEPLAPAEALDLYLEDKKRRAAHGTVEAHRSRLSFLVEWCEDQDIDNLNELTARDLHDYRVWRRETGDLSVTSEKTNQDSVRVFVRWCESVDAVRPGLHEKVQSPSLSLDEDARDVILERDDAEAVLEYLGRYEYATAEHVVWRLIGNTGMRVSTARSFDVGDYHPDARVPHLDANHRSETGTPLKNGTRSERKIGLDPETCTVLDDYLADQRPAATDDHGRRPLLASSQGRLHDSTIRGYAYKWTRPCALADDCPHGRKIDECEAAQTVNDASKCPSSLSAHPVRRGYITHELRSGTPRFVVSDRCDVSEEVIEKHYDERSETERMAQRQEILDEVHSETTDSGRGRS